MAQTWDNRIVRRADVPPDQLLANPKNFRRHTKAQKDAFRGLVKQVGYVDPVLAVDGTDIVIDGHLRVEVALEDGIATVPVDYYAGSEAEADLILATKDPLAAMAYHDAQALDALMRDLVVDDPAVVAMLADLAANNGVAPPTDDDWMDAFDGGVAAGGDLDTVNLTFVLPLDAIDDVKGALARLDPDKNVALVRMARQCLA